MTQVTVANQLSRFEKYMIFVIIVLFFGIGFFVIRSQMKKGVQESQLNFSSVDVDFGEEVSLEVK